MPAAGVLYTIPGMKKVGFLRPSPLVKISRGEPRTLRERIAESLRESIIRGLLGPGERIAEPELALAFGISRTPIREALRQLESEGFLTVRPHRGAIVSPITPTDVREFYAVKGLLEGDAARLATPHLRPRDIARLTDLNRLMGEAARRNDVKEFFDLDNQFHEIFHKACGNEKLRHLIHSLVQHYVHVRIAAMSVPGRMQSSVKQHQEIVKAAKAKDAERVGQVMRGNAEQGAETLVRQLRQSESEKAGGEPRRSVTPPARPRGPRRGAPEYSTDRQDQTA